MTLENVREITDDITTSTRFVAEQVVDTTLDIKENVDVVFDKIDTIKNIIDVIRSYFKKK